MLNDPSKESENEPIEVRCYFVRQRNALVVRGDFSTVYRDYYLHLMQHGLRYEPSLDQSLKDALAGVCLHLASRPRNEAVAWTLSWQDPLHNLFVTGSNRLGNVTGRIFTEDVREQENNLFFSQATADGQEARQSMIEAQSDQFLSIVEDYYQQSEQRPARIFHFSEEDLVMISAQPDCDLDWLHSLTNESVREMDQVEELSLLENRYYTFDCGCSLEKLIPVLGGMDEASKNEMFPEDRSAAAILTCPRCSARYALSRETLEGFLEE